MVLDTGECVVTAGEGVGRCSKLLEGLGTRVRTRSRARGNDSGWLGDSL